MHLKLTKKASAVQILPRIDYYDIILVSCYMCHPNTEKKSCDYDLLLHSAGKCHLTAHSVEGIPRNDYVILMISLIREGIMCEMTGFRPSGVSPSHVAICIIREKYRESSVEICIVIENHILLNHV